MSHGLSRAMFGNEKDYLKAVAEEAAFVHEPFTTEERIALRDAIRGLIADCATTALLAEINQATKLYAENKKNDLISAQFKLKRLGII